MKHNLVLSITGEGAPHQWLHWQDAITLKAKNLVSFEMGDPDMIMGGTSRMTGERTSMTIGTIIGIKGKFKHQAAKTPVLSNPSLFKRDLLTCGFCGHHFSESHLTRDHIVPVSKGGKDIWMNCVAACKKCNGKKGNKSLEDAGMELLWVPYVPNRYEALILANRHILADQAEYVAGFIPKHSRVPRYLEQHCGISINN
jgi:hypothetical protein